MIAQRRLVIAIGIGGMLGAQRLVRGQPAKALRRIGIFHVGPYVEDDPFRTLFKQGMHDLGWMEGKNVEYRVVAADNDANRLDALARELVAQKVDAIVAGASLAVRAAQRATKTIPIVMAGVGDPVSQGFVASLARPGGNITGIANQADELLAKLIQILHEVVPSARRIAVLLNETNPKSAAVMRAAAESACTALGLSAIWVVASEPAQLVGAVERIVSQRAQAVVVVADPMYYTERFRLQALLEPTSAAGGVWTSGERGRRRAAQLYLELRREFPACGDLRRQDPQRRQARRPARRAADPLPTDHQPENRQGAGTDDPVQRDAAHRRGDRMIARRCALAGLAGSISLLAAPSLAQQAAKVHRIGYLASGSASNPFPEVFRKALLELGWVEGQNVVIEFRFAESQFERLPGLVAELLRFKPDVIVAAAPAAALAVKNVTTTIPIVMANAGDPVRLGLVASLARPGGNVTGTAFSVELQTITKGLQLLKEAIPKLSSVAVLSNPANPLQADAIANLNNAARFLGVQLLPMEARSADELDTAFATMMKKRAQALLVVLDSLFVSNRARLAALALQHRLPSMYSARESVVAGGMMSYGPSLTDGTRRAALYVDKILKGAKPADLAVEQPTRFELVINLKTAKALGLSIPYSVRLRADEVIE